LDFYLEYHSRWWWDVSPDCALRGILVHFRDSAPLSVACGEYFVMDEVESSVCRCLGGEVGWGRFERGCKGLGCRGEGRFFGWEHFEKSLDSDSLHFINHLHPNFEMISWISQFAKYLFEFPLGLKWSLKIYFSGFVHLSQSCFVTYSNPMH